MLHWALFFFMIAMIAGCLGFGNMSADCAYVAQILFLVFMVLFAATVVMGVIGRGPYTPPWA